MWFDDLVFQDIMLYFLDYKAGVLINERAFWQKKILKSKSLKYAKKDFSQSEQIPCVLNFAVVAVARMHPGNHGNHPLLEL